MPEPAATTAPHAVLVGGGAAGTLLALALRRRAPHWRITVVDRHGAFGRGLAYATPVVAHRLNVPAARMGGLAPDDRAGYARWLAREAGPVATVDEARAFAASFSPRQRYGDYLSQALRAAVSAAPEALQLRQGDVRGLRRSACPAVPWLVELGCETLAANAVVLCTGHPPPARLAGGGAGPGWVDDVWAPGALRGVGRGDAVLVVGSGATAIDAVLSLWAQGHRGPLTLLSRHGLLPRADEPASGMAVPPIFKADETTSLRVALRRWREATRRGVADGQSWQAVFDAGRLAVPTLWRGFSLADRARALRHLRPWWMVHRHRLAPDVAQALAAAVADGRLQVVAARFQAAQRDGPRWSLHAQRRGGGEQRWTVDHVLNCTGPSERYGERPEALWQQLRAEGLVQTGPLGLGLDVDEVRRLRNAKGEAQPGLHAMGLPCRGQDWEVTSIPYLQEQAEALAGELAGWKPPATAG